MADWESEDFEVDEGFTKAAAGAAGGGNATDKWDGEDEGDVKDAWDDSDDEKEEAENVEKKNESDVKAFQVKKKKNKMEEALKKKDEKRKQKLADLKEKDAVELTPEEHMSEKLKQQRLQEESDLELSKEMFGVSSDAPRDSLDALNPTTKEDFDQFSLLLKAKLGTLESSPFYVDFLEDLVKDSCINLDTDYVRRIGTCITSIANEKAKAQKAAVKGKKKSKKSILAGSNKGGVRDAMDANYGGYDDMEDFI